MKFEINMRRNFCTFLIISYLLINCHWTKFHSNQNDYKAILEFYKITFTFPNIDTLGNLVYFHDSLFVSKIGDTNVFFIPIYNIAEVNGRISQTTNFSCYWNKKGDNNGFYYQSIKDSMGIKIPVDTFLNQNVLASLNIFDLISKSVLIKSETQFDTLTKIYFSKIVLDETYNDSTVLTFSKIKRGIELPFCKRLDSLMGGSLIKARFIFNERFLPRVPIKLPKREMILEVQKIKPEFSQWDYFIKKLTQS